jgi:hypothetical protein
MILNEINNLIEEALLKNIALGAAGGLAAGGAAAAIPALYVKKIIADPIKSVANLGQAGAAGVLPGIIKAPAPVAAPGLIKSIGTIAQYKALKAPSKIYN